jgi:hypothetical protein
MPSGAERLIFHQESKIIESQQVTVFLAAHNRHHAHYIKPVVNAK